MHGSFASLKMTAQDLCREVAGHYTSLPFSGPNLRGQKAERREELIPQEKVSNLPVDLIRKLEIYCNLCLNFDRLAIEKIRFVLPLPHGIHSRMSQ